MSSRFGYKLRDRVSKFVETAQMTNLLEVDWTKIPAPIDDGATDHLLRALIPSIQLNTTDGTPVDLSKLSGLTVIYVYPMTGRPDETLPIGWDAIPGARGCTPQSCGFRDHFAELQKIGVRNLFGLSTQNTEYQIEAVNRLHLPFPLISDANLLLSSTLNLPLFEVSGRKLLKRMTLIIEHARIVKIFYPVFPPDRNAADVIDWLQ
jgi:peroxiredoxin